LLQVPQAVGSWAESVTDDCFTLATNRQVFAAMVAAGFPESAALPESAGLDSAAGFGWAHSVIEACPDDEVRRWVRELVTEPLPMIEAAASPAATEAMSRYAVSVVASLLDRTATRQSADLRARLGEPEIAADQERMSAVMADLIEVEQYRRSLRPYWAGGAD
jgi:DNA primase